MKQTTIPVAIGGAALLLAGALAPALAKGPGDPEAPITLKLLVWDQQGRQSEAVVDDLVRIASQVSDGAITIEPTFEGGGDTVPSVMDGSIDLAVVATRDWDAVGVTSLDVIEAPFLIDSDALAAAVATSDIATDAMSGLEAVGVTGLAMWPEDLRHLHAFNPSGRVFSTPADLADADVLVVAGQPGHDLIPTLGGRLYEEGTASGDLTGDKGTDADAGTLEGMVTGLWGAGLPTDDTTVASDLPVYAKEQVLVANSARLAELTGHQRQLLADIVSRFQVAAVGHQLTEAGLAADRCSVGGRVTTVGPDARAAFIAAAKPLSDRLAADPLTGPLMARVEALKEATGAPVSTATCEPTPPGSPAPAQATDAFIGDRLVPPGTYRVDVTRDELIAVGSTPDAAGRNFGTWTLTFTDRSWSADFRGAHCGAGMSLGAGVVVLERNPDSERCTMAYDLRWRPEGDGIRFEVVDLNWTVATPRALADERAVTERVWTRVEDAPAASAAPAPFVRDREPTPGTYRISVTREELVARGASGTYASRNDGTWTMTFADGTWTMNAVPVGDCMGTMAVANEGVQLRTVDDRDCNWDMTFEWRDAPGGIELHLLAGTPSETPTMLKSDHALVDLVWERVE